MTKEELLKCNDPQTVWDEMHKYDALLQDRDLWLHHGKLVYEENKRIIIANRGSFDPDTHYEAARKKPPPRNTE